jgi:hypothetical protein
MMKSAVPATGSVKHAAASNREHHRVDSRAKKASSQLAAGGEEEKYRQYIGCEKRPREWQVRDSDDRSHSPREG